MTDKKVFHAKEYRFVYETKFDKFRKKMLPLQPVLVPALFGAMMLGTGFSPLISLAVAGLVFPVMALNAAIPVNKGQKPPVIGVCGTEKKYLFKIGEAVTSIEDVKNPIDVAKNRKRYEDKLLYPILIDDKMPLTHKFVVGTTGAGKTTYLINQVKQIIDAGSGILAVDGKGDQTIYEAFYNTCVHSGREDDFRVINFNNPKESNTFNPLLKGDADEVTDIIGNMLETEGDNAFWAGRALSFMKGLLSVLVPLRDMGLLFNPDMGREEILTFSVINKWIALKDLHTLYWTIKKSNETGVLAVDCFSAEEKEKYKPIDLERLKAYLSSVYVDTSDEEAEFPDGAEKQHGNSYLMWNESLDMLAGRFGAIFDTDSPTIDMEDVVSNGRIVYILLPALKVDTRSLSSLGKIVLSLLKNAISVLLGDDISGTVEQRYLSFAKRPMVPFFAFMDEYGSYAVPGFDNVLAQARSLKVAVTILVQEIASLEKVGGSQGHIEKQRLLGNTGMKVALKLEEQNTIEEVVKMLGRREEAIIRVRQEQQRSDEREIEVQEKDVVTVKMMKEMTAGHGYLSWAGEIVPMLVNYYEPPVVPEIPKFDYVMRNVEPSYRMRLLKEMARDALGDAPSAGDDETSEIVELARKINDVFDTKIAGDFLNRRVYDASEDVREFINEAVGEYLRIPVEELVERSRKANETVMEIMATSAEIAGLPKESVIEAEVEK